MSFQSAFRSFYHSRARNLVALLATAQALLFTNNVTLIAITGLAGAYLATDKTFATLPMSTYALGTALTSIAASIFMQKKGRRLGFSIGAVLAMLGAAISTSALLGHSLAWLCAGTFVTGMFNAFAQGYRFAAADAADAYDKNFKEVAISLVLAGGLVGGILGPETAKFSKDLLAVPFAGSYITLALFGALTLLVVSQIHIPIHTAHAENARARSLRTILRQPACWVAILGAAMGYGIMNLLMTATPLSMQTCGYAFKDTAFVIEWHVIAMFAPSFFTGGWIKRFGAPRIMCVGAMLMLVCVGIGLSGTAIWQFWLALVLVGIGWNFLYVGGTTLLTTCYTPSEKGKVQGLNDMLVFTTTIITSFSSGLLFNLNGWYWLNKMALPFIVIAGLATAWLALKTPTRTVA